MNVDSLYAAVGRKPALLREVVEPAISGQVHAVPTDAVPTEQRDYIRAIRAAPTAVEKINAYAAALAKMAPRTAPVFLAA